LTGAAKKRGGFNPPHGHAHKRNLGLVLRFLTRFTAPISTTVPVSPIAATIIAIPGVVIAVIAITLVLVAIILMRLRMGGRFLLDRLCIGGYIPARYNTAKIVARIARR
jgi:hypothetical protein